MKKVVIIGLAIGLLIAGHTRVAAVVRVVASTADLASIARLIGGEQVKVESIVNGRSDPHFVEVLPSYMVKIARAQVYLKVGMELDFWANQLIDGSGNAKLIVVDCSENVERLEVPATRVDASMGDVHTLGNPHYWLDPANAAKVARTIAEALKRADARNAATYEMGLAAFEAQLQSKVAEWTRAAESLAGLEIVTYHNSWPYLAKFLNITIAGFVEPKPGIEPTPSHTAKLIELIRVDGIQIIGKEPYFSDRTPRAIANETGAKVVDLPPSVGGADGADDYFSLMDTLITTLKSAAKGQ